MRKAIERLLELALILLFVATVLAVSWQVIGRYVLAAPSSATEEISRFLLIWLGTLSMVYAFAKRMHVGVDLISARLGGGARKTLARFIWLACGLFAVTVMIYGGGRLVNITATLGQTSAALGISMWTIYTVMPISGVIVAYFALSYLIEGKEQEDPVAEELSHD